MSRKTNPHIATQCFARDIRTRGETALHRAAAFGDLEMILTLKEAGLALGLVDAETFDRVVKPESMLGR